MPRNQRGPDRAPAAFVSAVGVLYLIVGLALNEFVLARIVLGQRELPPGDFRGWLWLADLLILGCGIVLISRRNREAGAKLALAALSLGIVAPLAAEAVLRLAIAAGIETVRDPRLYAGWLDDEDQWKLRYRWVERSRGALEEASFRFDPVLGWAPKSVPNCDEPAQPRSILVYGDSFMHGVSPLAPEDRIPQRLEAYLSGHCIVSLAASGYGLDQIFLSFRESHQRFRRPMIVLGIMTLDLDRCLFSVRDAPKPRFTVEADGLQLHGVPLPDDTAAWHRRNPPDIHSYVAALLVRKLRLAAHAGPASESPYKQSEKRTVNGKILEAVADLAATERLPILTVLFYPHWELYYEGWRETFLRQRLASLDLPMVDTKRLFLEAADGDPIQAAEQFYLPPPNGHPNAAANHLIAEAIAASLSEATFSAAVEENSTRR